MGNGVRRNAGNNAGLSGRNGQSRFEWGAAGSVGSGTGDMAVAASRWRCSRRCTNVVEASGQALSEVHRAQEVIERRASAQRIPQGRDFEEDKRPVTLAVAFL